MRPRDRVAAGRPGRGRRRGLPRPADHPSAREVFRIELPTDRTSLAYARRILARWLEQAGAAPGDSFEIQLASHEACANAIEHAHKFGDALVELEGRLLDQEVALTVRDRGSWREQADDHRGRGLDLMNALMDGVTVNGGPDGTEVELRRRLRGQPRPEAGRRARSGCAFRPAARAAPVHELAAPAVCDAQLIAVLAAAAGGHERGELRLRRDQLHRHAALLGAVAHQGLCHRHERRVAGLALRRRGGEAAARGGARSRPSAAAGRRGGGASAEEGRGCAPGPHGCAAAGGRPRRAPGPGARSRPAGPSTGRSPHATHELARHGPLLRLEPAETGKALVDPVRIP